MRKYQPKKIKYIPLRFLVAMHLIVLEILAIIGLVVLLCYYVPYFYLLALATQISCIIKIIASDDNPDYKVPWLFIVLIVPVAGFMLYFMFSQRKLSRKFRRRLKLAYGNGYNLDDSPVFENLKNADKTAYNHFKMIKNMSGANLFNAQGLKYYPDIEVLRKDLLEDLKKAEKFIYLEFFIIQKGVFWDSILEILVEKANSGVEVKVLYDDIGCMQTLPAEYGKALKKVSIEALQFSRLKGSADGEFNNRNHRKMLIIDGQVAYTGGFNLADEYINKIERFGHWKDNGLRVEGEPVYELTKLFTVDYSINTKREYSFNQDLYPKTNALKTNGYVMPFGDGPRPVYEREVAKSAIQNMLASANDYAYITTPYLIIDNDLLTDIENASLRGVDVRIIVPHIPDKKLVFTMSRSYYHRLMSAGVKIYEYTPGFIHAKTYLVDDKYAMIGTVNLDYRSLIHHFENAVLLYDTDCIFDIKADVLQTIEKSELIKKESIKNNLVQRFICSLVRIFAPML